MASQDALEMSRQNFALAYDGETAGPINVDALAPALLAVGKLIRESNALLNGKKSKTKVFVTSDFERKCFHVNFEAVLGILAAAQSFLSSDYAKDAKKVLQVIGFVKPEEGNLSLLDFLKWKGGHDLEKTPALTDIDENGFVKVSIPGNNNNVTVHNTVVTLSENSKVLKAARDTFAPIGQDGFEQLKIADGSGVFKVLSPEATQAIIASCNAGISKNEEDDQTPDDVEVSPAWLVVYSPVYDKNASSWRFRMGRDVIYADIRDTKIAEDSLARGGSLADDSYQVQMEITTPVDAAGKKGNPSYKIIEVIKFVPAKPTAQQTSLFDGPATG